MQNYSREEAMMAAARPHGGIIGASHADGAYTVIAKYSALKYAAQRLHSDLGKAPPVQVVVVGFCVGIADTIQRA